MSPTRPPFLIAEAGVNHDGQIDVAFELIDRAAEAGADAVKFQTFRAEELVASDTPRVEYQATNTGDHGSQLEMLRALQLPDAAFERLAERCHSVGIAFMSSPHTESAVDVLADLVPAFKIGSGDVTNQLLLERAAETGLGVILGTGMSTIVEVERALSWLEDAGAGWVIPLHCTTSYPCADQDVNLLAMKTLADTLDRPVGYSDHTSDSQVPIMAAALGAVIIEKHFTLDRSRPGPDHAASMEPTEFRDLAHALKRVATILGRETKQPTEGELRSQSAIRKGLVAARDLRVGEVLTRDQLRAQRPVGEIGAEDLATVIGKTLRSPLVSGQPLRRGDFE